MRRQITYLKEKYACDIRLLRTPVMPVSSSEIRQMIRGGETEDLPYFFIYKTSQARKRLQIL